MLFDGFHFVPSRNFSGPIFPIAGIPFANRNAQIRNTASTGRFKLIDTFPTLALSISGAVEDLSSSQPVAQAPVVIIHYANFLLVLG